MEAPLKRVILPNGMVDWEVFHDLVKEKDFLVYDPPQKKRSFWAFSNLNIFTPRSPVGVGFPCCVAESVRAKMRWEGHDVQHAYISKPDEWFLKMLEPPAEGNRCPEFLRGIWWMKDNVANETLLSFESAHWGSPGSQMEGVGIKHVFKNWSKGSSMWGSMLAKSHEELFGVFKVSPDFQWINLDADNWIYILQAGDKLVDPSGTPVPFRPGDDLLRVTWNEQDPKKGIYYQYLVRRVAFKDESGKVQKVHPAYDELLDRATRPTLQGVCCNLFLCNISDAEYGSAYDCIDDHQIYIPGPEHPGWKPDDFLKEIAPNA